MAPVSIKLQRTIVLERKRDLRLMHHAEKGKKKTTKVVIKNGK